MEQFLTKIVLFANNIFTNVYGEVFQGFFHDNLYYAPNCIEQYFYLLPSFINHFYGKTFYSDYLYSKNDVLYLKSIGQSNTFSPPLLEFKVNDNDFKININKFSNNIPLKYIFNYNYIFANFDVYFKYLKNGMQEKTLTLNEIKENTLTELLN